MREAVGGSLLLYLIIPIFILIIFFVGFVMNYASAYRAGNYVISRIEGCNGEMSGNCSSSSFNSVKDELKKSYGYVNNIYYCCTNNTGLNGSVYRVYLPVCFDVPLIGSIKPFNIKVESKTIYKVKCEDRTGYSTCANVENTLNTLTCK